LKAFAPQPKATSDFRWARLWVTKHSPEGRTAVERLEASAKLFRGLTVAFLFGGLWFGLGRYAFGLQPRWDVCLVSLGLACLWLYRDAVKRWQRDKTAFEYLVDLDVAKVFS
jgi:hypothetical protein